MVDNLQKYRQAALDGIAEIAKLTERKKAIESDISKILQIVAANIAMFPDSERRTLMERLEAAKGPSGLKEAVYSVLSPTKYMSAVEVRDAVISSGFDLSSQVNPLASVSTTLRRFESAEKPLIDSKEEDGKTVYRRKGLRPLEGLK
jgi:hypothetical protein